MSEERSARAGTRLLAAVVLSACVGVAAGGLSAWAVYQHFGPTQRVVTQTKTGNNAISVGDIATAVQPSLMTISTQAVSTQTVAGGQAAGLAEGFAVSSDGLIVTTAQAVRGATRLRVATADGHGYDATIAATDIADGIVVLRAAGASGLRTLSFATSAPRIGDLAISVSTTLRGALQTRSGVVASTGEMASDGTTTISDVVAVDATPDPNAGGAPLVDSAGNVTGVVFVAPGQPGITASLGRDAAALLTSLSGAGPTAATFGVTSEVIGPAAAGAAGLPEGALIEAVDPNGPAATLLHAGDVVTAVNGESVTLASLLVPSTFDLGVGQTATLSVTGADGSTRTVTLTVAAG